jgi:hypothetical protein
MQVCPILGDMCLPSIFNTNLKSRRAEWPNAVRAKNINNYITIKLLNKKITWGPVL